MTAQKPLDQSAETQSKSAQTDLARSIADSSQARSVEAPTRFIMNLKAQLKLHMELKGWTAAALAKRCGIPKQRVSDLLAGIPPRKLEILKKIATELETTMDHLCFGEGVSQEVEVSGFTAADSVPGNRWVSGLFEIQFRRIRK